MIKNIGKDILKSIQYGCVLSSVLTLIGGLLGIITSKTKWISVLESIKATLFVVGSIGLLMGAVAILIKHRKKDSDLEESDEWKKKFKVISFKTALIIISFVVLIYGCIVDGILFKIY